MRFQYYVRVTDRSETSMDLHRETGTVFSMHEAQQAVRNAIEKGANASMVRRPLEPRTYQLLVEVEATIRELDH